MGTLHDTPNEYENLGHAPSGNMCASNHRAQGQTYGIRWHSGDEERGLKLIADHIERGVLPVGGSDSTILIGLLSDSISEREAKKLGQTGSGLKSKSSQANDAFGSADKRFHASIAA